MNKASKNRRYLRLPVSIPSLVYRPGAADKPLPSQILNLSLGGALIRCGEPTLKAGEEIILEIRYEDGFLLKGRVTQVEDVVIDLDDSLDDAPVQWANDEQSGTFRVEFLELPPEKRRAFLRMLATVVIQEKIPLKNTPAREKRVRTASRKR